MVVDGGTLSAAAAGVVISGKVVGLEAGAKTINIKTRPFVVPTATEGNISVQAFPGGARGGGWRYRCVWFA